MKTTVNLTFTGKDSHFFETVKCDYASWNGSFFTMGWGDVFTHGGMAQYPKYRIIPASELVDVEVLFEK